MAFAMGGYKSLVQNNEESAQYFKAFALTGRQVYVRNYPGRCPGLGASALSGRVELTCET